MPSKPLDRATIREIIDLLSPFCGTPSQRRALFTTALGFHPVLNGLNYEDDTMTFLPNAIAQLHAYGEFEDGKTALWLVLEEVRARVGLDKQRRIDALEVAVNGGVQAPLVPVPQVVTPSVPPPTNHERQIAALLKQLEVAEAKGVWDIVIDLGEKILALDEWHEPTRDKTANAYYERGRVYTNAGDHERAIFDHTRAIELDAIRSAIYHERGKAYNSSGDYALAIEDNTRAIQLNPNNADYYCSRGINYLNQGDSKRALGDFDRAVLLDPTQSTHYYLRGLSYIRLENENAARADFQRASYMGNEQAKEKLQNLKPNKNEPILYRKGMRVKHPKLGEGTVISSNVSGKNDMEVTVKFDNESFGIKRLLASFANLIVLN